MSDGLVWNSSENKYAGLPADSPERNSLQAILDFLADDTGTKLNWWIEKFDDKAYAEEALTCSKQNVIAHGWRYAWDFANLAVQFTDEA